MINEEKKEEKEELVDIVTEIITARCKESNDEFPVIQTIGHALNNGDRIFVQSLPGGKTNFSFKAYLKNDPSKALFAKLAFNYALWNPDRTQIYDLDRASNEFEIMQRFAEIMGGDGAPVPKVYFCENIPSGNAKLFVAEWSDMDEQFARQFVEGHVDPRVLTGVADAIATLNLEPVHYEWNENCRECMSSLHPLFKQKYSDFCLLPQEKSDSCTSYCKELGVEKLHAVIDNLDKEYMETRQVLCHNDTNPSNILVEQMFSPQCFGEKGNFAIVDWEMSIKGRSGKDAGILRAWPIACAYCHAVQGHGMEAYHLLDSIDMFWNAYERALIQKGDKDEAYVLDAFHGSLGATYLYLNAFYYMMGIAYEDLPLVGVPQEVAAKATAAMGKTGLQLGEIAYLGKHSDLSLEELKQLVYNEIIKKEIDSLIEGRASSELPRRASGKIASGSFPSEILVTEQAVKCMSRKAEIGGRASKRASICAVFQCNRKDWIPTMVQRQGQEHNS